MPQKSPLHAQHTQPAEPPGVGGPIQSLVRFAQLTARLAVPFADPDAVLEQARTSRIELDMARDKWAVLLRTSAGFAELFARTFRQEVDVVRSTAPPATWRPVAPLSLEDASNAAARMERAKEARQLDETLRAPSPLARSAALPFRVGRYTPVGAPALTDDDPVRSFDSEVTEELVEGRRQTLPFVLLPSNTLKPRR